MYKQLNAKHFVIRFLYFLLNCLEYLKSPYPLLEYHKSTPNTYNISSRLECRDDSVRVEVDMDTGE